MIQKLEAGPYPVLLLLHISNHNKLFSPFSLHVAFSLLVLSLNFAPLLCYRVVGRESNTLKAVLITTLQLSRLNTLHVDLMPSLGVDLDISLV